MKTIILIVLFLFSIFLIYNGLNSLKKLVSCNQKWALLESQQSAFYYANFLEAKSLIDKLKKYIPFLVRLELLNGTLVILLTIVSIFTNIASSNLSAIGTVSLILFGIAFLLWLNCSHHSIFGYITGAGEAVNIPLTKRYQLLIDFLDKECRDNFCEIYDCFDDYVRAKRMDSDDTDYRNNTLFRFIILFFGYLGFLLFIIAFYFDTSFQQLVINLCSKPFN